MVDGVKGRGVKTEKGDVKFVGAGYGSSEGLERSFVAIERMKVGLGKRNQTMGYKGNKKKLEM